MSDKVGPHGGWNRELTLLAEQRAIVSVYVTATDRERVRIAAARSGQSSSAWARGILLSELEANDEEGTT